MPAKGVVIEALLLAFSNSRTNEIVSSEALRDVLEIEYREIVEDGALDLQQVWELLEEQPGFSPEIATPPLCLFKTWEDKLGLKVTLPDSLADRSDKDLLLQATECPVGPHQLQQILSKGRPKSRTSAPARDIPADSAQADAAPPAHRPLILAAAVFVTLASFVFAGYHLKEGCAGPQWHGISTADFAGELPIRDARRIGAEVGAELSDPAWIGLSDDIRRDQLETALQNLERHQVDMLFVTDDTGQVRASAQFLGDSRQIRVRFQ